MCIRDRNVGDGLSGSDELSFFKSTPPQFPITRSYYYGVGAVSYTHLDVYKRQIILLVWLPRSISKPIQELTRGILEIANHNYEKRLDMSGHPF